MEVIISVPIWDATVEQTDFTENFLFKVLSTKGDWHLCIVDNASTSPETLKLLSDITDPRITVIHNESNKGYSVAANQGIFWGLERGATYGVVMNNDVELITSDWLEQSFIEPLRNNPKQFIGARLIDFNEATDYDGKGIIPYLEGWLIAAHKDFWNETKGFDESMLAYHEDVDLSIRAVLAEYPLVQSEDFDWVPFSGVALKQTVFHYYGRTGYVRPDFDWRKITEDSHKYMMKKWGFEKQAT